MACLSISLNILLIIMIWPIIILIVGLPLPGSISARYLSDLYIYATCHLCQYICRGYPCPSPTHSVSFVAWLTFPWPFFFLRFSDSELSGNSWVDCLLGYPGSNLCHSSRLHLGHIIMSVDVTSTLWLSVPWLYLTAPQSFHMSWSLATTWHLVMLLHGPSFPIVDHSLGLTFPRFLGLLSSKIPWETLFGYSLGLTFPGLLGFLCFSIPRATLFWDSLGLTFLGFPNFVSSRIHWATLFRDSLDLNAPRVWLSLDSPTCSLSGFPERHSSGIPWI